MIDVRETRDPTTLLRLLKDESIRTSVGDDASSDEFINERLASAVLFDVMVDEAPVATVVFDAPAIEQLREMHVLFPEGHRGAFALDASRKAMAKVLTREDTDSLVAQTFSDAPHTGWFARQLGFRPLCNYPYPFTRRGKPVSVTVFEFTP